MAPDRKVNGPEGHIEYVIERRPRRKKTIGIQVRRGGDVRVLAPTLSGTRELERAVKKAAPWIHKKRKALERFDQRRDWSTGDSLMLEGSHYPLFVVETPGKKSEALFDGQSFTVTTESAKDYDRRAEAVRNALKGWYFEAAQARLPAVAASLTEPVGLEPDEVHVKDLKSSWGCCYRNKISLNWRLLLAPREIIEYVALHELCHLRHKNHSVQFWSAVGEHMPDFRERRECLREMAHRLEL